MLGEIGKRIGELAIGPAGVVEVWIVLWKQVEDGIIVDETNLLLVQITDVLDWTGLINKNPIGVTQQGTGERHQLSPLWRIIGSEQQIHLAVEKALIDVAPGVTRD